MDVAAVYGASFVMILLSVAYYILIERKILGAIQTRHGPNKPSLAGVLLPLADGLKLILKEVSLPSVVNSSLFLLGPLLIFLIYFFSWAVVPYQNGYAFMYWGCLLFLCCCGVSVFGVIVCGWSSGGSYSLLGGVRASAQSVSYEAVFGTALYCPLIFVGSFDFYEVDGLSVIYSFCMGEVVLIWFVSCIAELNRVPFDFVEGESELVSGYMVEYGGVGFTLLILGEYGALIVVSMVTSYLFFGGLLDVKFFSIFTVLGGVVVSLVFIFLRGCLPRYRYDKLMSFCWTLLLPLISGMLLLSIAFSV
uniref:NADH-ubiquinone oxidoreductase chain 1 n=1 Tax=Gari togata TaxID=2774046 RepID=A0A8K0Z4J4_9BIVA|nr:NADH dehydrogenase subunit 1 [Gari togata]